MHVVMQVVRMLMESSAVQEQQMHAVLEYTVNCDSQDNPVKGAQGTCIQALDTGPGYRTWIRVNTQVLCQQYKNTAKQTANPQRK